MCMKLKIMIMKLYFLFKCCGAFNKFGHIKSQIKLQHAFFKDFYEYNRKNRQ